MNLEEKKRAVMIKNDLKEIYHDFVQHKSNSGLNMCRPLLGRICSISINTHLKKMVLMVLFAFLLISSGCITSQSSPESEPPDPNGSEVPIYYALNESHSNSWVQQSAEGVVGIVYGVINQGAAIQDGRKTGNLIYKTIMPDGSENEEAVTTDKGVDKCVLLYDSDSYPHIFFARSDNSNQEIFHFYKNDGTGWWIKETVINLANEGGKFIYELSADIDKNDVIHLLVLKTRSNPDSEDFWDAYKNSHLYYITNVSGNWEKTLIHQYDTFYTYDNIVKTQRRQDIAVDDDGYAHVVFGEQYIHDPPDESTIAILHYATNKSSQWVREIALKSSNVLDDSGWWPSLCLDKTGRPVIASTYLALVQSRSAKYARLCYSVRLDNGEWETTEVAKIDDGYYGTDGRNYTGALPHLKFDLNNRPHIVFSDIASSHNPQNVLSTGQIRYAVFNGTSWDISTIYRQPSPQGFYQGKEMGGQCLVISADGEKIQVVGQELNSTAQDVYTYNLVHLVIK